MPFWEWLGLKTKKDDSMGRKNGNGGASKGQKKPPAPPKAISDPSDWVNVVPQIDPEIPAGAGTWFQGIAGEKYGRPLTAQELRIMNKRVAEGGAGGGYILTQAQKDQLKRRPVWVDEEWRDAV